jgi:hypothetical protein
LPSDACADVSETSVPHVLVAAEGACDSSDMAAAGRAAGARAVIEVAHSETVPPRGFSLREVLGGTLDIPVLRVSNADGALLARL